MSNFFIFIYVKILLKGFVAIKGCDAKKSHLSMLSFEAFEKNISRTSSFLAKKLYGRGKYKI